MTIVDPNQWLELVVVDLHNKGVRPEEMANALERLAVQAKVRHEIMKSNLAADLRTRESEREPCPTCRGPLIADGMGGHCHICD